MEKVVKWNLNDNDSKTRLFQIFLKYFADRASQYIYLLISTNLMH